MQDARSAALTVLNRCFDSGAWSQQTLNSAAAKLDKREVKLASRLTLGVLQNYMLLDYWIDSLLTGKKKLDLPVRNVLRLGAYQILFSDRIPARAAVSESVALCRACGFSSACGLVNAVLRKIADGSMHLPADLSIRYSHPQWFVERMKARHGIPFTEALLAANNTEPPLDELIIWAFLSSMRNRKTPIGPKTILAMMPETLQNIDASKTAVCLCSALPHRILYPDTVRKAGAIPALFCADVTMR